MKHILASLLVIVVSIPTIANDGKDMLNEANTSWLYNNLLDPGHKQSMSELHQDKYRVELYLGSNPSVGIKLNSYGGNNGWLTESTYFMASMDFNDTDLHAKLGINVNGKSKYSNTRSLGLRKFGLIKLWRYVSLRQAIEIGYKTQFLDPEETTKEKLVSTNYGGLTLAYSWSTDALTLTQMKHMWYLLDFRTARRIRLKLDVGFFFNFDKFDQAHLGFLSPANATNGTDFNENVPDDSGSDVFGEDDYNANFGQPLEMATYPVLSPFVNFSIGFSLF